MKVSVLPIYLPPGWYSDCPGIPGMRVFDDAESSLPQDHWSAVHGDLRLDVKWAPPGVYRCSAEQAGQRIVEVDLDYPHLVIEWLAGWFKSNHPQPSPTL